MTSRTVSRRRLVWALATLTCLAGAAGLVAVPSAKADRSAPLVGVAGKCVDVQWSGTQNGTAVQLWDCNGTNAQNWAGIGRQGTLRAFGKCLDVDGGSHDDGARVQLWDCNGTGAQDWLLENGQLINTGSGKCLDAFGGAQTGTALQIRGCSGAVTQAWAASGSPQVVGPEAKKGVATWAFPPGGDGIRDVGASWYYDWSTSDSDVPAAAEFVPMIWGATFVTDADLATAQRSGRTLLGFNEPDLPGQANMSVEHALDLWPRLQHTGMRLGSPAVAFGADTPGGWLDRFLAGVRERGLRVDFIALHWYGSDFGDEAANHLMQYVHAVYERYRLPIWITEFGLIDFSQGAPRHPTPQQLVTFIDKATAALQATPYVERYAWFALPASGEHAAHGLYREDGTATEAGAAYRAAGRS
ncbi:ricin-type beta-trefoil lectin domain protein [Micromonospora fiedleri]|uniref:Ricin-type beta-trefoil lectin domain protein n=1 Tax=Micromonospora fiedleri TaxID=1157498 RepID=A0ABS1US30_9ACTN|nr:glycoside hydrolase family protein [Micromonospora fiedleri]MBL6279169.1 ricin-type beta-trefoil lectin domain protein [Micromonospora fiedleri]